MKVIAILAVLLAPILLLFGIGWLVEQFWKRVIEPGTSKVILPEVSHQQAEYILFTRCPYYKNLDSERQKIFLSRLITYMNLKEFSARKGLVITEEMRILISASAIQLTMGLKNFHMEHFSRIVIYPEKYQSKITGNYHKGEVNLAGIIAFSWKDFLEGNIDDDDNINLGLHEMAHALRFTGFKGERDAFFAAYFYKWRSIARHEYDKIREKKPESIFRSYAGSNLDEFFAVCIEHFFETPKTFRDELPELYKYTCILLNQDPAEMKSDVREKLLEEEVVVYNGASPAFKFKSRNNLVSFLLLIAGVLLVSSIPGFFDKGDPPYGFAVFTSLLFSGTWMWYRYTTAELAVFDQCCTLQRGGMSTMVKVHAVPYASIVSVTPAEVDSKDEDGHRQLYWKFELKYVYKEKVYEYEFRANNRNELIAIGKHFDNKKVHVNIQQDFLRW